MKIRDIAPFGVRMTSELKERLQEEAKKNGRSLNTEIVKRLEDSLEEKPSHQHTENEDNLAGRIKTLEELYWELRCNLKD